MLPPGLICICIAIPTGIALLVKNLCALGPEPKP